MSIMKSGRFRRRFIAFATCSWVNKRLDEPVAVTTISADSSSSVTVSQGTAFPLIFAASVAALAGVRFAMLIWPID